jgi:hypothetical protein
VGGEAVEEEAEDEEVEESSFILKKSENNVSKHVKDVDKDVSISLIIDNNHLQKNGDSCLPIRILCFFM